MCDQIWVLLQWDVWEGGGRKIPFIKWDHIFSLLTAQGLHQYDFSAFKMEHWFKLQSKSKPVTFLGTPLETEGNRTLLCN